MLKKTAVSGLFVQQEVPDVSPVRRKVKPPYPLEVWNQEGNLATISTAILQGKKVSHKSGILASSWSFQLEFQKGGGIWPGQARYSLIAGR